MSEETTDEEKTVEESTGKDISEMNFEEALEELKQIVTRLEKGEGRLDEAIDAYERGAKLKAHCELKLREAQAKIEKIGMGSDGTPQTEPLDQN